MRTLRKFKMNNEVKQRIEDLENTFNKLSLIVNNESSSFYGDDFLKAQITSILIELNQLRGNNESK